MKQIVRFLAVVFATVIVVGYLYQQAKPQLPISISFRNALFGPGMVAQLKNYSGQPIEISATVDSPATRAEVHWHLVILPGHTEEIGPLDGWPLIQGQRIELENTTYRTTEVSVPALATRLPSRPASNLQKTARSTVF